MMDGLADRVLKGSSSGLFSKTDGATAPPPSKDDAVAVQQLTQLSKVCALIQRPFEREFERRGVGRVDSTGMECHTSGLTKLP